MPEKWRQSKLCIGINDISQDSTAKHLSYDGSFHCTLITQFAGERIFKIGEYLAKIRAKGKMVDRVIRPICLRLLSSKMQNLPDK